MELLAEPAVRRDDGERHAANGAGEVVERRRVLPPTRQAEERGGVGVVGTDRDAAGLGHGRSWTHVALVLAGQDEGDVARRTCGGLLHRLPCDANHARESARTPPSGGG
ncbi:hypothetical protein H1Q78_06365 [Cellulosimicrobium cellulans]|nr:hypothetical protein H1Q78_06365 [Cellulosimicrobium cellulans]